MNMPKIVVFSVLLVLSAFVNAETFKAENYTEVEIAKLKATPEEYKNKRICYESEYFGYETTFPAYVEKSGFKAGKDYCLLVKPVNIPVMAEKNKENNELVPTMKKNSKVKVYGKIKKFMSEPEATQLPHYYLELEKIEVTAPPPAEEARKDPRDERRKDRKADSEETSPWRRDIGLPPNPMRR
ncbi:MAG TPA: hypothetical protein DCZ94_12885 [Lentisphaeria bacterium]|nr:MAG: hypothetical protein A2X48_00960 [Lentisphaerae bacterium GWF2_49_21]HBC87843.1 hypothetical protein [Lentisphaeria bacterium]